MPDETDIERVRRKQRERTARWRANNPERQHAVTRRRRRAEKALRARYPDEFSALMAEQRRPGEAWMVTHDRVIGDLKRRHAQEWSDLLAVTE